VASNICQSLSGGLNYGPTSAEVVLPNSATKEQLTIVCALGNNLPNTPLPTESDSCKFTKELKVGYWLVLDKMTPPQMRVITSIKSDTELTVDADFTLSNTTVASTLAHSGMACPLVFSIRTQGRASKLSMPTLRFSCYELGPLCL
jgi:hypothetical protein